MTIHDPDPDGNHTPERWRVLAEDRDGAPGPTPQTEPNICHICDCSTGVDCTCEPLNDRYLWKPPQAPGQGGSKGWFEMSFLYGWVRRLFCAFGVHRWDDHYVLKMCWVCGKIHRDEQ